MITKTIQTIICTTIIIASAAPAFAGSVNGYFKQNGTYVAPHYRSDPDSSVYNNYTYKGNVNPYNGKIGTRQEWDTNDCIGC